MRRHLLLVAVTLALVAAACSSSDESGSPGTTGADADPTTTGRPYEPELTDAACPVEVPPDVEVTCSTLTVPEDRERPEGRTVTLPVVRIHAEGDDPVDDPVIFLHGGPGDGTLASGIRQRSTYPTLASRDLILFDQRGAGLGTPALECPERELVLLSLLADDESFEEGREQVRAAVEQCRNRLTDSGIDLSRYSTPDAAADVADLRAALGVDEYNLWGVSYGTRLALEVMRSHPQGVRSAVLDSVYPPGSGDYEEVRAGTAVAIEALAADCRDETACRERVGDVTDDISAVVDRLDAEPFTGTDESGRPLVVTGDDAVSGLFVSLYDSSLIPLLPEAIDSLARGNDTLIPVLAGAAIPVMNDTSEGAYLSYECADNARIGSGAENLAAADGATQGTLLLLSGWYLMCDLWDVEATPASFDEPVDTPIPTLVIAGEYDPITPASRSRAIAASLDRALYVEVPRGGHTPGSASSCLREVIASFVTDPQRTNRGCVDAQEPVPFGG